MSASLVGSEMCIRDRRPPDPKDAPSPLQSEEACVLDDVARKGIVLVGPAVSYTHLTLPTICSV
eukprot:14260348-Alexandrium_andersonii.AAC.1